MKTITILSVAIATSLATHLAFATPSANNFPPGDCMAGLPAPGGMGPGNKGLGKKDKAAKRQAKVAEILAKFDTNQDGQITQDEVQAKHTEKLKAHAEKVLAKFDINQDGQITLDEVQAIHTDRFTEIDTDGNGFLSFEEFQKGAPRPPEAPMGPAGAPDDMRGPPPMGPAGAPDDMQGPPPMGPEGAPDDMQGPPPMGPEGMPEDMSGPRKGAKGKHQSGAGSGSCLPPPPANGEDTPATTVVGKGGKEQRRQEHFNRLDSDGDGQISVTEFMVNLPLFDKFDCDENGVITQDDLLQGPCQVPATAEGDGSTSPAATPPLPIFDKFDCNQDGVVTTEELQQGPCQKTQSATEISATVE